MLLYAETTLSPEAVGAGGVLLVQGEDDDAEDEGGEEKVSMGESKT